MKRAEPVVYYSKDACHLLTHRLFEFSACVRAEAERIIQGDTVDAETLNAAIPRAIQRFLKDIRSDQKDQTHAKRKNRLT